MKQQSLQKKFILMVGGSIAVLLLITALFIVNHISSLTRSSVEHDVQNLVKLETQSVEQFFSNYGAVARTFLNDPFLKDFFANYDDRGADDSRIANMDVINQVFNTVSGNDRNIKSAFFASGNTGEYFYEAGRVGVETEGPNAGDPEFGYFANRRPWFESAMKKNKFYVSPPAVDSQDGSVSAVVQSPIYINGQFIGIGGVDILISTIGDVVDKIRFQGQGTAFLLDENLNIVYFPKQPEKLELEQAMSTFDDAFADSSGFAELTQGMQRNTQGMEQVTWRGESFIVAYQHAKLQDPEMNWTLGILIPASIIEAPISTATWTSVFVALFIIAIITVVTYMATLRITNPLGKLKRAMTDIASGDGDLTKRIDIQSNDEVGMLATQFNSFTEKLRMLLTDTAANTKAVADASTHLRDVSHQTNEEIQQERTQVETVTTAVTEMASTVLEISNNASAASQAADAAEQQAVVGAKQADEAMQEINSLADSIHQAVNVVSGLGKESDNIGAVVDVINSIAEQTNLLALNAAIEAARAGEQGRGFAVVADEVRSLASRTQESTDDIRKMVERLQSIAQQTESVMQEGNEKTEQGVARARQVMDSLTSINDSIRTVQEQSRHIAVATEQQTVVAESINESLVAITDLSDNTASHAEELAHEATQLNTVSQELQSVVKQFKI